MVQVFKGVAVVGCLAWLTACGGGSDEPALVMPDANTLCSSVGVKPKIVNGADCLQPESSPVVLVLSLNSEGQTQSCSGTMLTSTRILTAAHCMPTGTQRMAAVQWKADGSGSLVYAKTWVAHPGYTTEGEGLQNDAGVVTLNTGLSNPSMPLLVSAPSQKGNEVFIAGWGTPGQNLAVGYARITKVTEAHIGYVYNGQGSNTCTGDSGGPAYRSAGGPVGIVGITSSGSVDGCGDGDNSLFTNIQTPRVLDFIRAQAPGLGEI